VVLQPYCHSHLQRSILTKLCLIIWSIAKEFYGFIPHVLNLWFHESNCSPYNLHF
jgi:hypothetical protein